MQFSLLLPVNVLLKKKKITILTPNPFPIGNVATNRFSTYAKVLASNGCDVSVGVLKGTEDVIRPINPLRIGTHEGVRYEYMASSSKWNVKASYIKKLCLYLIGVIRAVRFLGDEKPNSVVMYTNDLFYMVFFWVLSKIFGYEYFIDKSEYPIVMRRRSSVYRSIYLKSFKLFDGIFVMTNELYGYYNVMKCRSARMFLLPMSVDLNRFNGAKRQIYGAGKYFGCVFGVHNRDCIADTIMAFDRFCSSFPSNDFELMLVGDLDNLEGRAAVIRVHQECASKDRIKFLGTFAATEIPQFLIEATCLVTTPRAYQSGGFPTKLGEYLATGNVVIATKVGELPNYLEGFKNCLFSKPGCFEEISEMFEFVWRNPARSSEIGEAGRHVANKVFNVNAYSDDFIDFLFNSR